jgi:hypothetical protein
MESVPNKLASCEPDAREVLIQLLTGHVLRQFVLAQEIAFPGSFLADLKPEVALRKICPDCRWNLTRTCFRFLPRLPRTGRTPRRQRGCRRASAGGRDDGGGDGSSGGDPAQQLTNEARLSAASNRGGAR